MPKHNKQILFPPLPASSNLPSPVLEPVFLSNNRKHVKNTSGQKCHNSVEGDNPFRRVFVWQSAPLRPFPASRQVSICVSEKMFNTKSQNALQNFKEPYLGFGFHSFFLLTPLWRAWLTSRSCHRATDSRPYTV